MAPSYQALTTKEVSTRTRLCLMHRITWYCEAASSEKNVYLATLEVLCKGSVTVVLQQQTALTFQSSIASPLSFPETCYHESASSYMMHLHRW
jgi:hypothetical protein